MKKIIPKLIGSYLNTLAVIAPTHAGRIGFNIFCTPLAPPVKPHHKQFLDTATQFTFKSKGEDIQGYQWGNGPTKILFLHGWQSHTFRWKKYIEAFSKEEYTLYAIDAPAHGLSKGKYANIPLYSEALKAFLERSGAMDTVIAHSMGSFSTLHLLYHHSQFDIRKVILLGSPGEANDFISFYKKFTGLNDRTFKYIIEYLVKVFGEAPEYFSAPKFATALKVPGLIIHDEADEEAPYAHAQRIHSAWPQSQLITTQGFGHNLRAPEVVEMVRDFVMKEQLQSIGER